MKKNSALLAVFFCLLTLQAQSLTGIWQNPYRMVLFGEKSAVFVLKLFYGWYYDQAAELESVTKKTDGSWETVISYPVMKLRQVFPFALTENELFLDFYIRGSAFLIAPPAPENVGALYGFWRCGGNMFDITIDVPRYKEEIYSYFFTDSHVYKIRYWLTDVAYDEVSATVVDGSFSFNADKFLRIGDLVYTCVTGRGTSIRNVQKLRYTSDGTAIVFSPEPRSRLPLSFTEDGKLLSFSLPYLKRADFDDLAAQIAAMNARQRPLPKPPLPFMELDFFLEEINKLRGGLGQFTGPLEPLKLFFPQGFKPPEKPANAP